MLILRSLFFHLAWHLNIIFQMILYLPLVCFLSRSSIYTFVRLWVSINNFLHRIICGTKIEITGLEHLPKRGCIIAAKHQSIWEFYGLLPVLSDPCFVLKHELMRIPFFSLYVTRTHHIPIRRADGRSAIRDIITHAKDALIENRQIVIFVEGTRTKPGADPDYKQGISRMYQDLDCPVIPLALSSGLYWGKHSFYRHKGVLRAEFLPAIESGLSKQKFSKVLESRLESGCDSLYAKSSKDSNVPPLTPMVKRAIERSESKV